jgi:phage protein D
MTRAVYAEVAPVFSINEERAPDLARDCQRIVVDEGVDGLRTLEAHFIAGGPGATGSNNRVLHLDGSIDFGRAIKVAVGPDSAQRTIFDGTISAIEVIYTNGETPIVVALAEDAMMKLRMTRRMHTYRDVTDGDILNEIAGFHGLTAQADVDGPRYSVVQQVNQSDLALLRSRARLIQAELWCDGSTLHLASRPRRPGTTLTLVQDNDLVALRICADLAHQRSEVRITGYDVSAKNAIDESAGAAVVDAEITSGRTGPRIVERALSASVSVRVRETAISSRDATAWANAEMLRRARRFVTVTGTTRNTPDMVVGSRLELRSVGPPFEGNGYYVTHVCHTYDLIRGLRTRFEAERSTVNEEG